MSEKSLIELIDENEEPFEFKQTDYISLGFLMCNEFILGFVGFYFFFMMISGIIGALGEVGILLNRIIVNPLLVVGPYFLAYQIYKKEPYHFDHFWLGFKHAVPLILIAIIQMGAFYIIMAPFNLSEHADIVNTWLIEWQENPVGMNSVPSVPSWYLLLVIPLIYLFVSWVYAPMFVIFRNMTAWNAMEASRKIVGRRWFGMFWFLIILGLISFSGVLFFRVGLLYTLPLSSCILFASWMDWMDFFETKEEENIDPMEKYKDAFR